MVKLVKESLNEDNEMDSVFGDDYKQHYTFGTTNPKYTPRKLSTGENAEDIKKIQAFAKEKGYEFGINKNKTPYISLTVYYPMIMSYDQLKWPAIVEEIRYTFTYTNWEDPISLRKVWYGMDSNDTVKNWYEMDPKNKGHYVQGYRIGYGKTKDEQLKAFLKYVDSNPDKLNSKSLKQNLMGRFPDIETALERVMLNMEKEKHKQK
jgi:hypothetical protein